MKLMKYVSMFALLYTLSHSEEENSYINCKVKHSKKLKEEVVVCKTNMTEVEFIRGKKGTDSTIMTYDFQAKLKNGKSFNSTIETNYKNNLKVIVEDAKHIKTEEDTTETGIDSTSIENKLYLTAECPEKGKCTMKAPSSSLNELENVALKNNLFYDVVYNGKGRKSFKIKCRVSD